MKFAHLDQPLELARGEAHLYYFAVATVWQRAVAGLSWPAPAPISAGLLLALPVLERLGKRLYRVHLAEQRQVGKPSAQPRRFKLSVDELAATMQHVWPGAHGPVQVILGRVQQKSLNLGPYVRFS